MNYDNVKKEFQDLGGIKFYARGIDEIAIYSEIFNSHQYKLNYTGELVVVDIGMNVGLASLYFSGLPNVQKVYSYEPFQFTFDCAIENINLNPHLKDKINPFKLGISNEDGEVNGIINIDYKGNSSITRPIAPGDVYEAVQVRKAGNIIRAIMNENPILKIAVKIDCEGGEEKIFSDQGFLDVLDEIVEVVMETHTPGLFAEISQILVSKGFKLESYMLSHSNGYIKGYR